MPKLTPLRLCVSLFLLAASFGAHAQTVASFEGIDASQVPRPNFDVDPNGAVGTKQYMEWTNVYYQAWSKTSPFTKVWTKPQPGTLPFTTNGVTQCATITGDGLVLFDRLASRWVIAAHNAGSTNYYYCIAISNTDDLTSPTLAWFTYAFALDSFLGTNSTGTQYFPDWPKLATWPDAYYLSTDVEDPSHSFAEVGVLACAFDRANMIIGATANPPQCFRTPSTITGDTVFLGHSLEPADVEGTTPPPAGTPETFASIENPVLDGVTTTSDTFNLWQFHVDWSNPANSTFTQSTVPVTSFQPGCYVATQASNTICVPEPSSSSTNNFIDSVGDRFMFRLAYRNFGSYESYLASHTIQVGTGNHGQTGIRWYELRGSGVPSLYQSGTISPDQSLYRFMPSIAQDQNADAGVGYATSSSAAHPGMSASWWNLNAQSTPTEITLFNGVADEENTYHWGDYSSMTVDPVGGCAFWYVDQYFNTNQTGGGKPIWQTRISNFSVPSCGTVTLEPSTLSFGSQAVGTSSSPQQVVLNNGTTSALTINNIFGSGTNPSDFKQTNDCGSSVAAGSSCIINVTFAPMATGSLSATLNVSDSAPNTPQTVSLSGTGASGSSLNISPTSINFGNQADGTTSSAGSITVTNNGSAAVTFTSIQVTGTHAANFGESDNCVPTLAQGNSCTINVTFSPTTAGSYSASVTLTDNATGSPQSVSLTGTGILPVTLSSSSISFGTVLVGSNKTASPITLTNQMNVALTGVTVAASGSGYSQVNTCGTSVAAGGTCTITVTFTPTAQGTSNGNVTITDSANNSPQVITLTGNGQLPVSVVPVTVSFGTATVGKTSAPKTVTITNHQKTTLTIDSITITGTDPSDFAQQSTTCGSTLAAGTNCTVSLTFTPTAKGTRTATLQVTDSAATSPQDAKLTGTGN